MVNDVHEAFYQYCIIYNPLGQGSDPRQGKYYHIEKMFKNNFFVLVIDFCIVIISNMSSS